MNNKPLTPEEVTAASEQFFGLYKIVRDDLMAQHQYDVVKPEDVLKSMEQICGLAQKLRVQKEIENQPFGFNKKQNEE
jgi:hypothetical protein